MKNVVGLRICPTDFSDGVVERSAQCELEVM